MAAGQWHRLERLISTFDTQELPGRQGFKSFVSACVSWELGRRDDALSMISEARRLLPFHDKLRVTEIRWLLLLGRLEEALALSADLDLKVGPVGESRYVMGTIYLRLGRFNEAQAAFDRALNCGVQPNPSRMLPSPVVTPARLLHDFKQLQYMLDLSLVDASFANEVGYLRSQAHTLFGFDPADSNKLERVRAEQAGILSPEALASLSRIYKRVLRLEHSDCPADVISIDDRIKQAEAEFFDSAPKCRFTVIDDLLTPDALSSLREYMFRSWIWLNDAQKGFAYVGAYEHNGFRTPIIDKIDVQLRRALAGILDGLKLSQVWSYRNILGHTAVGTHADFAKININFWVTEDRHNLEPQSGGLLLYPIERPEDWEFERYNGSDEEIGELISGTPPIRIPFKMNRAVVFDSKLFHSSDRSVFFAEHEGFRTNVTFLYD